MIYTGFGDWISNTGPVDITYTDGSTWHSEFVAKTESIVRFRVLNGKLFLPYIDPRSGYTFDFGVKESGGWTEYRCGAGPSEASLHVFDMLYAGGYYWACGAAKDNGAAVWRTADYQSGSWTRYSFPAGGENRIYSIWELGGTIYCLFKGSVSTIYRWNGSSWVDSGISTTNAPQWNHHNWTSDVIYTNSVNTVADKVRSWNATDGAQQWDVAGNAYDVCVYEGTVYALADDDDGYRQIKRSADLTTWESIALTPTDAECLTVANDIVYVGTSGGSLYSFTLS